MEIIKILLSPQEKINKKISYKFKGEVITATTNKINIIDDEKVIKSKTDTFDLSVIKEGVLVTEINTTLNENPILNVYRKEDILYVELLNYIDSNATEREKFPEWQEV